eukprot:COSAG02_NODE_107_length_36312_cov_45.037942_17_plen_144_part_00
MRVVLAVACCSLRRLLLPAWPGVAVGRMHLIVCSFSPLPLSPSLSLPSLRPPRRLSRSPVNDQGTSLIAWGRLGATSFSPGSSGPCSCHGLGCVCGCRCLRRLGLPPGGRCPFSDPCHLRSGLASSPSPRRPPHLSRRLRPLS